jgi:hypothetical protein
MGDEEIGLCDTCWCAYRNGASIEEERLEVEDLARSMTARFASAEGKPCTCGAGPSGMRLPGPVGSKYVTYLDFDVHHADDCPRGVKPFDWPEVDEDAREHVFGYRGREYHGRRLIGALREVLADREWEAERDVA